MAEEGTLSIVRRGSGYQVRYASNHPYDPERPPHACPDEETLRAFLHHVGLEAGAIHQACAAVQTGGVAVLRILLSPGQRQASFPLPPPHEDTTLGAYYAVYQSGAELLGVGLTTAAAVQDAERWSDRALPSLTSYGLDGPRGETRGAYYLRPCTPELYAAVQAGGRSIPYAVNEEGYLAVLDPREA
jgi:hypothetical protein